ncbi:MAG: substrate-binding domain-containing protein [Chloroflexi bacterium]|nr:substrate-binding domain-containing protein [Chloroflexota bacterium]
MRAPVAVTAVAVLALVASACSSSASSTPSAASSSTPAAGKAYKLTLIQGVKGDPFYVTMGCGAQAEATKEGATLTITGGDKWDAAVQTVIVDSVTASKPDGVMIAPNDAKAMFAPLKAMNDAGIKVTLVDTGLEDLSFAQSFITSNNLQGGQLAAKALAKLIGDKGTVLVVNTNPGVTTVDARVKGFYDELKNHPNITALPVQYDLDDPTVATTITTSTLAAHPDLVGIFATNVQTAEGVATGLKQAGNTSVQVIAFDAGPKQIADLKSGIVQGLIAQDPYTIGVDGVQQTILALNGQPTTKSIQTDLAVITKDNMNDPSVQKFFYKSSC